MTEPFDRSAAMMPSVRRLAPQLVVAGVLPLVGYVLLRPHVGSDATALAAVMVFPVLDIVLERHRHGGFEPIGIISLIGIAVGIVGAVVFHGNATLLKVRESLVTGLFGVVCLGSLAARRPTMYYLGRAFATGGDPEAVREFDTIWDLPGVPGRFRLITVVWGATLVGEAAVRTVLAVSVPTRTFLIATPVINWGVLGALLWFTAAYRRRGERQVRTVIGDDLGVPGQPDDR